MRYRLGLATVLLLAASPAFARPSSPGLSPQERCAAWIDNLHADLSRADPVSGAVLADGGCRYDRVDFQTGSQVGYEISVLDVHGIDFDPSRDFGPPMSIRIDARGIEQTRTGLSGAQEWMLREMANPFDVVFDLTLDPATKAATLHELSLTAPVAGRMELDAVVEGTDELEDNASTRFGLRTLHTRLDSQTLLTRFVMPALIGFVSEPDPANAVAQAKLEATIFLTDALPRAGASPETIAAILGVVADLPQFRHPFELRLTTPGAPIAPRDVDEAIRGPDGVAAIMAKMRVEATYDGQFTAIPAP